MKAVIAFRDSHRTSPFIHHLNAVSESINGLGWVAVEPAPAPYCREMMNAAVFYTNRVLKDYRYRASNIKGLSWFSIFSYNTVCACPFFSAKFFGIQLRQCCVPVYCIHLLLKLNFILIYPAFSLSYQREGQGARGVGECLDCSVH